MRNPKSHTRSGALRLASALVLLAFCGIAYGQQQYQTCSFSDPTHCYGVGPGTTGQAYVSNGSSAYPSFSSSLPDVTSVGGVTIPQTASEFVTGAPTTTAGLCFLSTTTAGLGSFGTCPGGGGGTVTSFSFTNGNGFTGTVTNSTTTPTLSLSLSLASPGAIGGTTPSTGAFTTLSASGQFTSTVATGTAPFAVSSTTQVANLQAATAGALAATPTTCSATQAATGILANGNATGCFTPSGSGTVTDGSGTTTANELLLSSTTAHAYTNATTLPTSALPALAGDVTSSAGSNSVTVSKVNGASVPANANCLSSNSGSQLTAGCTEAVNAQTGTTYTIASTDCGKQVTFTNAAAIAVTVPAASGTFATCQFDVADIGAGTASLSSTSTINGSASALAVATNQQCTLNSDGTNWQVIGCTALSSGGSGITLENGGTSLGTVTTLNCSTGMSCSAASGVGTLTASGSTLLYVTSDVVATGTTPVNVVSFTASANTTYVVTCYLTGYASAGANEVQFTGPATPTLLNYWLIGGGIKTAYSSVLTATTSTGGVAIQPLILSLENGSTSGSVTLQVLNSTAADTATIKAGSFCKLN